MLTGYSEVWLNPGNDYIYRHIHLAGDRMCEMANEFPNESKSSLKRRILNQCARELVLAQSSDWAFIITNNTMVDYAKRRTKEHIGRFTKMYEWIKNDNDLRDNDILSDNKLKFLEHVEAFDPIFPEIDYTIYL